MTSRCRSEALGAWVLAACAAAACATQPEVVVSGHAFIAGEHDHQGIVVSLAGARGRAAAVTDAEGLWSLRVPGEGPVTLTLGASDTVEGSQVLSLDAGQTAAPDVVFQPAGRVSGRVVEAATGAPLHGALVLATSGKAVTTTDREGAFALSGVPAGPVTLVVSSSGLALGQLEVTVTRGVPSVVGDVALGPLAEGEGPATLEGRVEYVDGTPAPRARVVITGPDGERETVTDTDGAFHFYDVLPGAVALTASLPGFGAEVPTVLALEGTSGLIITDALYPLATNPVVLRRGRRVADFVFGVVTPDEQTLLGFIGSVEERAMVAVPIGGGAPVQLLSAEDLGGAVPRVAAVADDSRTVAVALSRPGNIWGEAQYFLASTTSQGRQLVANRGCREEVVAGYLHVVEGLDCHRTGTLLRVPLRFGAAPETLGTVASEFSRFDLTRQRFFDLIRLADNRWDVDLVDWSTGVVQRRRLLDSVASLASVYGPSPDGASLLFAESGGVYRMDIASGAVQLLFEGISLESVDSAASGDLLLIGRKQGGVEVHVFDAAGVGRRLAPGATRVVLSPDHTLVALWRTSAPDSTIGALSVVPVAGGPEVALGTSVGWFSWAGDVLLFVDAVSLSNGVGSLMRWAPGAAPRELDDSVLAEAVHVSPDGKHAAFARRRDVDTRLVALDVASGRLMVGARLTQEARPWWWSFSPDGRWLLYTGAPHAPDVLFVQPLAGGQAWPLAETGTSVRWLKDGSFLHSVWGASGPGLSTEGTYHATPN